MPRRASGGFGLLVSKFRGPRRGPARAFSAHARLAAHPDRRGCGARRPRDGRAPSGMCFQPTWWLSRTDLERSCSRLGWDPTMSTATAAVSSDIARRRAKLALLLGRSGAQGSQAVVQKPSMQVPTVAMNAFIGHRREPGRQAPSHRWALGPSAAIDGVSLDGAAPLSSLPHRVGWVSGTCARARVQPPPAFARRGARGLAPSPRAGW